MILELFPFICLLFYVLFYSGSLPYPHCVNVPGSGRETFIYLISIIIL